MNNAGQGAQILAQANTCNNIANSQTDFLSTATPITVGTTGQRSFGSDARGTILPEQHGRGPRGPAGGGPAGHLDALELVRRIAGSFRDPANEFVDSKLSPRYTALAGDRERRWWSPLKPIRPELFEGDGL